MSWVDAAHVVRGILGLAKRRRKPHFTGAEPKTTPQDMGRTWHNVISKEADRLARRQSLMTNLAKRDPPRAAISGLISKMTDSEKSRARESMYRVMAEAFGNGDISWEEFAPYRKAHERKRQSGWTAK